MTIKRTLKNTDIVNLNQKGTYLAARYCILHPIVFVWSKTCLHSEYLFITFCF